MKKRLRTKRITRNCGRTLGKFLKPGCIEDTGNHKRIAPLLRFFSSKSEGEPISLEDHVENTSENQKFIHYMASDSLKSAKSAPFLEKLVRPRARMLLTVAMQRGTWTFCTALITRRFTPDSPAELSNKIYEMMAMALRGRWGRSEDDDEADPVGSGPETNENSTDGLEAQVIEPLEERTESDPWRE